MHTDVAAGVEPMCCGDVQATEGLLAGKQLNLKLQENYSLLQSQSGYHHFSDHAH